VATNKKIEGFKFGELNPVGTSANSSTSENIDVERMSPLGILSKAVSKASEKDILKGVGYYKAIVLRVENDSDDVGLLGRLLGSSADETVIRFKARIPELNAALPIPFDVERGSSKVDMSEERLLNNKIIDMYPTFEAKGSSGLEKPREGALVFVDFGNRETFEDPLYVGLVSAEDYGVVGASESEARPGESKSAFDKVKDAFSLSSNPQLPNLDLADAEPPQMKILPVPADRALFGYRKGKYGNREIKVREDLVGPLQNIKKHLNELGTVLVSVGGVRPFSITPKPGGGAIATSLHYTALALDLWPKIGCNQAGNPERDQYVVQIDPGDKSATPKFIVWSRSNKPDAVSEGPNGVYRCEKKRIPALDVRGRVGRGPPGITQVQGYFVNLTQIFMDYGFKRISGRRGFYTKSREELSEYWHFEFIPDDLQPGVTYGETLEKIYKPPTRGKDGLPWDHRRKVWTGSSFSRG